MSLEPDFLTLGEVLQLHKQQLEFYGGSSGIRDQGALESALQAPQWAFHYGTEDFFELAAAYLFHLVQNHAFVDGNKRIGTVCALAFLDRHGLWPDIPDEDFIAMVLGVAQGQMDKPAVADFFRRWISE